MTNTDTLLRTVLLVIAALFALPLVMMLVAAPFVGGMHAGTWDGGMSTGTGGWVAMMLLPLLFLFVIGYGGYRLLQGGEETDAAIEELRRAYARGELSDEEYETRRQRLEADLGDDR
jgi:putative membrane protein